MKNKAEVIKAVETCLFADTSCNNCPYCDITDCVNHVVSDLRAILNKSDFEVMKEILGRSRLYARDRVDNYGQDDWKIISIDGYDGVDIEFDMDGNII